MNIVVNISRCNCFDYLARPACFWHAERCADSTDFLLNGLLGDQLSQNTAYWTDLQVFRMCTNMGGHDHSDLLVAIAQGTWDE